MTSQENPADLGCCGGRVQREELWWRGPKWLAEKESWLRDFVTSSTPESQGEAKVTREVFAGAREVTDEFDVLVREVCSVESAESLCLDFTFCEQHPQTQGAKNK